MGYGYRDLNENLAPLRRYLHSQVGRPWSKVFSEICATIDRRSAVQRHIYQHIDQLIATRVEIRDGRLIECGKFGPSPLRASGELYVDPRTGLIRRTKAAALARASERERRQEPDIEARRRILDECTQLLKLEDAWFRVSVEPLPKGKIPTSANGPTRQREIPLFRFDVVMRELASRTDERRVSGTSDGRWRRRLWLYGSGELYAFRKRQLSKREIKAYGLR